MRAILKATALLGVSSAISSAFGLLVAKASAAYLGPAGVGYLGLVQSLIALVQLIGGLGLSAGIVRFGAGMVAAGDRAAFAAIRRAGIVVVLASSAVMVLVLVVFRVPLSRSMLGDGGRTGAVLVLAAVVVFSIGHVLQLATINAYHRVTALATVAITSTGIACAVQVALFRWVGIRSVPYAVAVNALVQFATSTFAVRMLSPHGAEPAPWSRVRDSVRQLVRFGAPYMLSALAGNGTQLMLPAVVLALLDVASVGYFRASFAFSSTYLSLVLTSMSQDYYPRLSAQRDPRILNETVNQQARLLLLLGGPLVLMAMAFAPTLLHLVYSAKFLPAVAVLRWQLIGDVFKFQAWALSFVVLAKARSTTYLVTEISAGALLIAFVMLLVRSFGLAGLGMAYAAAYLVYSLIVWVVVRRLTGFRWDVQNLLLLAVVLALCAAIRLLPDVRLGPLVASAGAAPAAVYACFALWRIYHEGIRVAPPVEAVP